MGLSLLLLLLLLVLCLLWVGNLMLYFNTLFQPRYSYMRFDQNLFILNFCFCIIIYLSKQLTNIIIEFEDSFK